MCRESAGDCGWGAEFLDFVRPRFGLRLAVFDGAVDQKEPAAAPEDAGGFTDEIRRRTEMMRGDAAGDEIKRRIGIRKLFGGVLTGLDSEAALRRGPGGAFEHGEGDVRQRDIVTEGGKEQAGVACAGGDIKGFCPRRGLDGFHRELDVLHVFEDMSAPVAMALAGELFLRGLLNFIEFHRGDYIPTNAVGQTKARGRRLISGKFGAN